MVDEEDEENVRSVKKSSEMLFVRGGNIHQEVMDGWKGRS